MKDISQKTKKAPKNHILLLLVFLTLLITLSLISNTTQKQQNIEQPAQTKAAAVFPIYGTGANVLDGLASGWTTSITYGTADALDLYNQSPVYNGTNSIRYTITAPFDGFTAIAPASFDITPYNYLTFYIQAGEAGQRFNVKLIGAENTAVGLPVEIIPIYGYWTVYNIPISSFSILNKNILGIAFQDSNGRTQNTQPPPPIYFDEINFSADPAAAPSDGPSITVTAEPTPEIPYYPDISPWIFIIPVVIVLFAAIIFQ